MNKAKYNQDILLEKKPVVFKLTYIKKYSRRHMRYNSC